VELNPDHDESRRHLARCLTEIGRYANAVHHLEILLHKYPDDASLQTTLAVCKQHLNQPEEAARLLDAVLRDHPDFGPALRERGRFALAAARFTEAEASLKQAVRVLPYDYQAHWALHQALKGLRRTDEADAELAAANRIKERMERISEIQKVRMSDSPLNPALHCELGELLIGVGNGAAGERWLLSALQLDGNFSAAHAALARFYEAAGDTERAARHREQAGATPAKSTAPDP
jgi:predicted Zn-dependent protease